MSFQQLVFKKKTWVGDSEQKQYAGRRSLASMSVRANTLYRQLQATGELSG